MTGATGPGGNCILPLPFPEWPRPTPLLSVVRIRKRAPSARPARIAEAPAASSQAYSSLTPREPGPAARAASSSQARRSSPRRSAATSERRTGHRTEPPCRRRAASPRRVGVQPDVDEHEIRHAARQRLESRPGASRASASIASRFAARLRSTSSASSRLASAATCASAPTSYPRCTFRIAATRSRRAVSSIGDGARPAKTSGEPYSGPPTMVAPPPPHRCSAADSPRPRRATPHRRMRGRVARSLAPPVAGTAWQHARRGRAATGSIRRAPAPAVRGNPFPPPSCGRTAAGAPR